MTFGAWKYVMGLMWLNTADESWAVAEVEYSWASEAWRFVALGPPRHGPPRRSAGIADTRQRAMAAASAEARKLWGLA